MGKPIGIDSVIMIYLLEDVPLYRSKVKSLFYDIQDGMYEAVMSVIGMIEILTGPKQKGNIELVGKYQELISHFPHLTIVGINEHIVELASDLRAQYRIGTPDAIHVATALDFGAKQFITNDKGLKRIKEIKVELI